MFSVLTLLESYTGAKVDDFMSDPAIVEHYKVYLEFQKMTQEAAPSASAVAKTAHVILSEEGEEEEAGATERSVASGTPQQQSSNASIDGVAHVTKGTWHRNDSIAPPSLLEAEMWNLLPGTTISDQVCVCARTHTHTHTHTRLLLLHHA
jgi:hypothetical protein